MLSVLFSDLRASLESDGWCLSNAPNSLAHFTHPKGQSLTVWVDSSGRVVLTLPGRHINPDLPIAFRRQ